MRKLLIYILLISCSVGTCFAKDSVPLTGGYVGTLPDVTQGFRKSLPAQANPLFESQNGFSSPSDIKPIPRDNAAFVNVILKKDKTSQYINDINDIIPVIEKVYDSIEKREDLQKFASKVHYLNFNVDYIRRKYENRSESNYISFLKLMEVNMHAMSVSTLRSEGQIYSPYLAYSESGYIYNPNNIDQQLEYLQKEIEETIIILKEAH